MTSGGLTLQTIRRAWQLRLTPRRRRMIRRAQNICLSPLRRSDDDIIAEVKDKTSVCAIMDVRTLEIL
jgi:hypothetical protein